jgi:hypothetical protein
MIWKLIPGTGYAASDQGLIKNLVTDRILKPVTRGNRYAVVVLHGRQEYVHRMVLYAFTNCLKEQANHKNRNRLDNRLENLEWVTAKENIQHYLRSLVFEMESAGQMRLI